MKKLGILVAASLLAVMASSTCFAVSEGQNELSLFGSISSRKPDGQSATDTTTIVVGLGHFLTDNVSVGGDAAISYSKQSGGGSGTTFTNLDGNAKYHFNPKDPLVPYVGVQAGFMNIDMGGGGSGSGFSYGLMGGVDYFLSENASINAELNYRADSYKISGSSIDESTTALLLGLSYYFGK